ncbi:MAG: succinate--CoA ligase subunit alpha [Candidatus Tectomicrobia bacterium]|uniref:Succinate--CoA ligase [ADP-forming] subunit alpha n=1 Tax=Tectimicrobiota bacterium TaxID=2528274 RepID=A0A932I1B9_UNCTE|nr:succinate--CoA ligase subunit alpha [Candidatus Tectomicrobia bacterium]
MSILIGKETRVLVQGITGKEGNYHAQQCMRYSQEFAGGGGAVVAGVTPGKGGGKLDGALEKVPVFDTVAQAVAATGANASLIFVPPPFAADAIVESVDAGVPFVVCITEGIPVRDMVYVKRHMQGSPAVLIGPNCPGVITPGGCKMGIMPGHIHKEGSIGVISKSGTLTYEVVAQLTAQGLGQTTCVGIGGDPIIGTMYIDLLRRFQEDPATEAIIMIGEIGGSAEQDAARWAKKNVTKPMVGFIAGQTAPKGRRMGHAGAIISGGEGTAAEKMRVMAECGIRVTQSPAEMGLTMARALGRA